MEKPLRILMVDWSYMMDTLLDSSSSSSLIESKINDISLVDSQSKSTNLEITNINVLRLAEVSRVINLNLDKRTKFFAKDLYSQALKSIASNSYNSRPMLIVEISRDPDKNQALLGLKENTFCYLKRHLHNKGINGFSVFLVALNPSKNNTIQTIKLEEINVVS